MNFMDWFIVGWLALGSVITVSRIGKTNKPTTPQVAAVALVVNAVLITVFIASHR